MDRAVGRNDKPSVATLATALALYIENTSDRSDAG